jgi:TRAP-type mannitol/chloroaromatic compound transport system permease small subunit
MPNLLLTATSAVTRLNQWIFMVTVWLMAVVVPVMLYEVIARYVFNSPTVWGMELAVLLFGPYFLLGGPYLLHLKGHVALDIVRQRLNGVWKRRMDLVNYPMIVLFCAILLYFSIPPAWSAWNYKETSFSAWNPPIWPVKLTVPLALLLMMLQAMVEWVRVLFESSDAGADNGVAEGAAL